MKVDLGTKDGAILAGAVRGPDGRGLEPLKAVVTGFIRYKMGCDPYGGMLVHDNPLSLEECEDAKALLSRIAGSPSTCIYHWARHARAALGVLNMYSNIYSTPMYEFVNYLVVAAGTLNYDMDVLNALLWDCYKYEQTHRYLFTGRGWC